MSNVEAAFLDSISDDTALQDRWRTLIALATPVASSTTTGIPAAPHTTPAHIGVASPRRTKIGSPAPISC